MLLIIATLLIIYGSVMHQWIFVIAGMAVVAIDMFLPRLKLGGYKEYDDTKIVTLNQIVYPKVDEPIIRSAAAVGDKLVWQVQNSVDDAFFTNKTGANIIDADGHDIKTGECVVDRDAKFMSQDEVNAEINKFNNARHGDNSHNTLADLSHTNTYLTRNPNTYLWAGDCHVNSISNRLQKSWNWLKRKISPSE